MSQLLVGRCGFEDATMPAAGKSEWGMDTITRRLTGHISNLAAYVATLSQGLTFEFNGAIFYLQSWEPDEQSPVASITLTYLGLINGTPPPDIRNEVTLSSGNTSADYSAENFGAGRLYAHEIIATIGDTTGGPGDFGTTAEFYKNSYAVSATMEFTYRTVTTTYRYVSIGQPSGPTYDKVQATFDPAIERVRIITSDGRLFGKGSMGGFNLTPVAAERVISFQSQQVIGSPFYLCEDVVRKELVQDDDI